MGCAPSIEENSVVEPQGNFETPSRPAPKSIYFKNQSILSPNSPQKLGMSHYRMNSRDFLTPSPTTIASASSSLYETKSFAHFSSNDFSNIPVILEFDDESSPRVIQDFYEFGEVLGSGGYATVKCATNKETGVKYAIKIVDRAKHSDASFLQEVSILRSLDHPNIVKYVDLFRDDQYFYLVIELVEGGELGDILIKRSRFTEKESRSLIKNLVSAVQFCHDREIVHRDIKLKNLLLTTRDDNAILKICDYGISTYDRGALSNLSTFIGTPEYMAPEIISGQPYGKAVDMWAVGVICYTLINGSWPFQAIERDVLYEKIKKAEFKYHPKKWNTVSKDCKNFISSLLEANPKKRLSATDALQHPWLKNLK